MNPARSLGPAIDTGDFTSIWVYLTAPFLGAVIAAGTYQLLRAERFTPAASASTEQGYDQELV